MTAETPPAGWYDDPEDPSAKRYWDGKDWTPHRQRKSIASSAPPPPQSPPPPLPPPPQSPPPPAPMGGLASGQQALWDQPQSHLSKARGFWSRLPRQRWVLFAAVGLLAIVIGVAALRTVFHSVTGGPKVGKSALQSDIIQRMGPGFGADSVTCADLPGAVGKTASCEVKMPEGVGDFEVIATVTRVDGGKVAYDLAPALTKEQLEQHIQDQNNGLGFGIGGAGGPIRSVSCESGLQGKDGAEARCKFSRGGGSHGLTARVTNVDGLEMSIDYMPDH
jgi:Protein of unknown function (DUF2510)/Domain of unknown function (DUF4333)